MEYDDLNQALRRDSREILASRLQYGVEMAKKFIGEVDEHAVAISPSADDGDAVFWLVADDQLVKIIDATQKERSLKTYPLAQLRSCQIEMTGYHGPEVPEHFAGDATMKISLQFSNEAVTLEASEYRACGGLYVFYNKHVKPRLPRQLSPLDLTHTERHSV